MLLVDCSLSFSFGCGFLFFGLVGVLLYWDFVFLRKNLKLDGLGKGEDMKGLWEGQSMIKIH